MYHTLFESHLTYCISVWGGAAKSYIEKLFILQKKCIRILFGDLEAYLDKFRTCARARPYGDQILGAEFFRKESTKPLFTEQKLLTIHNLYTYHCCLEIFKILKFRAPLSLHDMFNLSHRKHTLVITEKPTDAFVYRSAVLWNKLRKNLPNFSLYDFSIKLSFLKTLTKSLLFKNQGLHDQKEWCQYNFELR